MKSFVFLSTALHGALLALFVVGATLLSQPKMSYYAVDLVSSFPAGAPGGGATSVSSPPAPAEKPAPPAPIEPEQPLPSKEAIRMPGKEKKQPHPKPQPAKPKAIPRLPQM